MTEKISILMATYNGEKYLKEQLNSLFSQTLQDFKIIIRDDMSTDNTIKIVEEFQNKYSNRIELIKDNLGNLGSSKSFMELLKYSESQYIMFCDQDDVWLPDKINISLLKMKELEETSSEDIPLLVFTDLKIVDQNLNIIQNSFWLYQKLFPEISRNWKKILAQNVITGCTILMNKKAKSFCFPFKLPMMIHDQWIAVNVSKYGKIDFTDEQTILYRQHGMNVAGAHKYGLKYIFKKIYNIKNILFYFKSASRVFKEVSVIELILFKILINIKRMYR